MEDQKVYKNIKLDSPSITGKVTGEHQTTQEDWRIPTLLNSWVNYDATQFAPASYMKDTLGFVHLQGLIKNGTITAPAFILPKGYRPLKWLHIVSVSSGAYAQVEIKIDGNVVPQAGSNTWYSLSGITFRAEQ